MKKILLSLGIVIVTVAIVAIGVLFIKGKTFKTQNPIATIQIEGYEKPIKVELDPQSAPNAVANFIKLANNGFYTNFKMTIGEDSILGNEKVQMAKLSNITENPQKDYVYGIKGEFSSNGFKNDLKHEPGVLSMARAMNPNSAGSQFFIMHETSPHLDGDYAAFGKVIEGLENVNAIAEVRTDWSDRPLEDVVMKRVTVETFGEEYGEPEKC